jgi:hypothetical protein
MPPKVTGFLGVIEPVSALKKRMFIYSSPSVITTNFGYPIEPAWSGYSPISVGDDPLPGPNLPQ